MHDRPLQGIEWRLTHHLGPQGELVPIVDGVMATATFIDGSVAGSTGCNRYHAPYRVDDDRLTIELIAMTMMACDPERSAVESAFTSALQAAATYAIAGDRLDLADANGRVVLRLRAVPEIVLGGSRWIATMINNGRGGVASLVEGTVVTAEFGADGRVAGSGGCNQSAGATRSRATASRSGRSLRRGWPASSRWASASRKAPTLRPWPGWRRGRSARTGSSSAPPMGPCRWSSARRPEERLLHRTRSPASCSRPPAPLPPAVLPPPAPGPPAGVPFTFQGERHREGPTTTPTEALPGRRGGARRPLRSRFVRGCRGQAHPADALGRDLVEETDFPRRRTRLAAPHVPKM